MPKNHCINLNIDGMAVVVRTSKKEISPSALNNIREFIKYVKSKGGDEYMSNTKEDLLEVPYQVGKAYFFQTVTYFYTGRVKAIVGNFLVLEEAAWIADTGRFANALATGEFSEVEPVQVDMQLNINSITGSFQWKHPLPRQQK